jgi:hypothetical protein
MRQLMEEAELLQLAVRIKQVPRDVRRTHHHRRAPHSLNAQDVYHNPDNLKRSLLNRASVFKCAFQRSDHCFSSNARYSLTFPTETSAGDHRQQRQPCAARHGRQTAQIPHILQILRSPSAHVRTPAISRRRSLHFTLLQI